MKENTIKGLEKDILVIVNKNSKDIGFFGKTQIIDVEYDETNSRIHGVRYFDLILYKQKEDKPDKYEQEKVLGKASLVEEENCYSVLIQYLTDEYFEIPLEFSLPKSLYGEQD